MKTFEVLRAYATAALRRWLQNVRNHDAFLRGEQSVAGLGTFAISGQRLAANAYRIDVGPR